MILDLKEKWGFFLIKNNINNLNGPNDRNKETIFKNFNKLKNEIKNNILKSSNKYKYRNPLIESNSIKLENLKRIVDECEIYSIGANYHIIYLLVKNGEQKKEILKYINLLKYRLQEFIKFFNDYLLKNLLEIEKYEGSRYKDLEEQMKEKEEMFNYILENINKNAKGLDIQGNQNEIQKEFLNQIRRKNGITFSNDIINYLYDLGIYFLYKIPESSGYSCIAF